MYMGMYVNAILDTHSNLHIFKIRAIVGRRHRHRVREKYQNYTAIMVFMYRRTVYKSLIIRAQSSRNLKTNAGLPMVF